MKDFSYILKKRADVIPYTNGLQYTPGKLAAGG